jgi:glutamate synthase domain-containing protein 2
MSYSKPNSSEATLTRLRTGKDYCPFSGMCVTCVDGCTGLCEIGKSAYRAAEMLYPQPFGGSTSASQKDYPVDFSHLNIMGTAVGAVGIDADPDIATFPNVNLETAVGADKGLKLRLPFVIPGLGSTDVAKNNWDGLAIGSAISGIILTIGENVCGMDEASVIENGRVVESPDMARRVKLFQDWYDGYGAIVVQANVEDTRLGVLEYALDKLGVEVVELKWGQGAKDIGGEVKIRNLEKARMLKQRGYIVLPDPEAPSSQENFYKTFSEFERHSRIGFVDEDSFVKRVQELRDAGAKYVFLKTGAYRPADLARAVKYSSLARIDLLTVDGAGGGTGMSPWRMMNEWGVPTIHLAAMTYDYAKRLADKGEYVPDIAIAGGFTLEDHIVKALAMGAPYFKLVGMARSPIAAAMVGKTIGKLIEEENLPKAVSVYGNSVDEIFVVAPELKERFGERFKDIPTAAMGVYSYYKRLAQGIRQLMCGARKFALEYLDRDDLASLTRECAEITGIPYVMDLDSDEVDKILG